MPTLNAANRVTDHAYDKLLAIHHEDREVFHHAHKAGSLRDLCYIHQIDPDATGRRRAKAA